MEARRAELIAQGIIKESDSDEEGKSKTTQVVKTKKGGKKKPNKNETAEPTTTHDEDAEIHEETK